jgi:hypothetical protein
VPRDALCSAPGCALRLRSLSVALTHGGCLLLRCAGPVQLRRRAACAGGGGQGGPRDGAGPPQGHARGAGTLRAAEWPHAPLC